MYQLLKTFIKIAAPLSLAYNNIPSKMDNKATSAQILEGIQPGDIIFSKTPALLYEFTRGFVQSEYDHVAVAINKTEVIHISPPVISKLKIHHLVRQDRCPIIYRPNLSPDQKRHFLQTLTSFLGEKYNVKAIYSVGLQQIKRKLSLSSHTQDSQQNHPRINFSYVVLKYSRICSDTILYALCSASQQNREQITKIIDKQTLYHLYGFSMPDDIVKVLKSLNFQVYYQSPTKYEQSTIFKVLKAVQQYPTRKKLHQFFISYPKQLIGNPFQILKKFLEKIHPKNLQKMLKSKSEIKYFNVFFDYYQYYLKLTLLLTVIFKITQYLGYKPSDNISKFLNVVTIALILLTFSIPLDQHKQIEPKL